MGKKHKWREGFRHSVDAEIAASELERIKRDQSLTAAAVVDASRPEDAALHPAFDWDDYSAAEKYRHQQASTLIRALVTVETEAAPEHRKFALVKGDEENKARYEDSKIIVEDADLFADAISRLEREVRAAVNSVSELEALARAHSSEPERLARIALAAKALETVSAAISGLH